MKRIALAAAALALIYGMPLYAEEMRIFPSAPSVVPETLFAQQEDCALSGYASLLCQGSRIGKSSVAIPGARAAVLFDNIAVGFTGYSLYRPTKRSALSGERCAGSEPFIDLGYGGFLFEYHFGPKARVNFSAGVTVGGGSYSFTEKDEQGGGKGRKMFGRNFLYVEPELAAYVNVSKYCRLGAGVSYRYFHHAGEAEFSDRDFRGAGATFSAAFGVF